MLIIRLQRRGKKHQATYRLTVGEKRSKLNGKQLEDLGWYNPHSNKSNFLKERIEYWMSHGAKVSDTAHNLFIDAGVIKGDKIAVHKSPKKTAESKKESVAKSEAKKEEAKPAETKA